MGCATKQCGRRSTFGFQFPTQHDVLSRSFGTPLLAAGQHEANSTGTTHGRLYKEKLSYDLPESSYAPGLVSSPLHFWMPPFIADRLSKGFQQFGKYSHGFLTNEATMIGVETRTSAPVRIVRDKDTLQHVRLKGLFPCGEGAGYAGGIVSAGIDGERCAEAVGRLLLQ